MLHQTLSHNIQFDNISHLATALGQGDGLLCEKGSYYVTYPPNLLSIKK